MRKICFVLIITLFMGICPVCAIEIEGVSLVGETLTAKGLNEIEYPEFGVGKIEAEDMYTSGYYTVNSENASGGTYIKLYADEESRNGVWGMAGFKYTGKTVKCSLKLLYPDFYSGSSPKYLYINGKRIAMWSGKLTYGTSVWGTKPEYTKDVLKTKKIDNVVLKDGDIITFVSKPDYGEYGELDYIEIVRTTYEKKEEIEVFSDISYDVNQEKILYLLDKDIIKLSEDGKFNPSSLITAEQFVAMLIRTLGYISVTNDSEYWAQNYIQKAIRLGYVDDSMLFTNPITLSEIEKIIKRIKYLDFNVEQSSDYITRSAAASLIYDIYQKLESGKSKESEEIKTLYELDSQGYITTWLYTGSVVTEVYQGSADAQSVMPKVKTTPLDITLPTNDSFSSVLDNGMEFNVLPMGNSGIINDLNRGAESWFAFSVSYVCCDIVVDEDMSVATKLTASRGYYDLYLDGEFVSDMYWFWSRSTTKEFTLNLKKGTNRLLMRIQNFSSNLNNTNVGIQFLSNAEKIKTTVAEKSKDLSLIKTQEKWAQNVTLDSDGNLTSTQPPAEGAIVLINGKNYDWPLYDKVFDFEKEVGNSIVKFKLKTKVGDNYLEREIELPQNCEVKRSNFETLEEHQKNYREKLIANETKDWDWSQYVLLRLNEGYSLNDTDIERIRDTLDRINAMADCAEFSMVHMLRLYMLYGDTFPEDLRQEIKDCILSFGYYDDEEGTQAMVMTSENHKVGFHTCQYIAGTLFPDEIFLRSGRTGREQREIAAERLNVWFTAVETEGLEEFNSASYFPVTFNALLNCYDFVDDKAFKQRAKDILDLTLRTAAITTFDGVSVGANARSYADALMYPHKSAKSMMLSYYSKDMNICEYSQRISGIATSTYQPPSDLSSLITDDLEIGFLQGGTKLNVKKTSDYLISSLTVPTPATGELANNYIKGQLMYHTHMWEASIGATAKTFVTHPGTTRDGTSASPSYWYGEFTSPVITQQGNMIVEIYNIPETSSIKYTHAYFTTDEFDNVHIEDNWLFAQKENGYIALWCSSPLVKNADLTINMEYIANNLKVAWICIASSKDESGEFQEFIDAQKAKNPVFDEESLTVVVNNEEVLSW